MLSSICYAETIFLVCNVNGMVNSTYDSERLPNSNVSVEITKYPSHLSIIISGKDDYLQSVSSVKRPGNEVIDLTDQNIFNMTNIREISSGSIRQMTTQIEINRVTGIIAVRSEAIFRSGTFRNINYSGSCQRQQGRKF